MSSTSPGQPEYLGPGGSEPTDGGGRGGRRTGVIAAATVAVVAAVGAGAYGVVQLMAGGTAPASAVPANALGYVSLDLDPSASQKIEAVKIMRKFPGLREELDIGDRDDLRRTLFEELVEGNDCESLSYDDDVAPWIGDRVGFAALPDDIDPAVPVVVLQVTDQDKAEAGVDALSECGESGKKPGVAFVGDYMMLAETPGTVNKAAKAAEESSLEDDEDYQTWMERAGDPGIVSMYAAKDAVGALAESEGAQSELGTPSQLEESLADFEGAAGVMRFEDGAAELEFVAGGVDNGLATDEADGPDTSTLPGSTALAFALTLPEGWAQKLLDNLEGTIGEQELEQGLLQAEQSLGLELPEDAERLLGDGFSLSVDGEVDLERLQSSPDPSGVPAGLRISGDPEDITEVIDKLKQAAGPDADIVKVESGEDSVVIGFDQEYLDTLLEEGDLGSVEAFEDVVPEAGDATSMLFVDFDRIFDKVGDLPDVPTEVTENLEPLRALGVSGWYDDEDVTHGLLRLSTD